MLLLFCWAWPAQAESSPGAEKDPAQQQQEATDAPPTAEQEEPSVEEASAEAPVESGEENEQAQPPATGEGQEEGAAPEEPGPIGGEASGEAAPPAEGAAEPQPEEAAESTVRQKLQETNPVLGGILQNEPIAQLLADEVVVTVTSFQRLREVLQDTTGAYGDTVYIYLAADIVGEANGILINSNYVSVTIDGSPPGSPEGERATYTDYNTNTTSQNATVRATSGMSLTIKNLDIYGYNYYGTFNCRTNDNPGAIISFDNVSYYGPQMVFNPYGTVNFHDVTAVLASTSNTEVQELCEATSVNFSGVNNISRTAAPSQGVGTPYRAIFYMYNSGQITAMEGAVVNISTTDYLYWNNSGYTGLVVMNGAVMTVNVANGVVDTSGYFTGTSHPLGSINVQAGGTLKINQTGGSALKQMLRLQTSLTVGSGAVLEVHCASNLSAVEGAANLAITFNNPERVIITSPQTVVRETSTTSTVTVNIVTRAANLWTQAVPTNDITSRPNYIWNKQNLEVYTITATLNSSNMTSATLTPALTINDPADTFSTQTFNLTTAKALVVGTIALDADPVLMDSVEITGTVTAGSAVMVTYQTLAGSQFTVIAVTSPEGEYAAEFSGGVAMGSRVEVRGHSYYLTARIYEAVASMRTTLAISPAGLVFKENEEDTPLNLEIKLENLTTPTGATAIVGLEWFRVSALDTVEYDTSNFETGYQNAAEQDRGTGANMAVDAPASNTERNYEMPVGENGVYWVRAHYTDENGNDIYRVKSILVDSIYTRVWGSYMGIETINGTTLYEQAVPGTAGSSTPLAGVALDLHSATQVLNSTADGVSAQPQTQAQLEVNALSMEPLWVVQPPASQALSLTGTSLGTVVFYYSLNPLAITVQFNAAGGLPADNPDQYYIQGDSLGELPRVEQEDYLFVGWFTQPAGGAMVQEGDTLPAEWEQGSTVTLYAQWIPVEVNLTLSHTVAGAYGDMTRAFTFTLYFTDESGAPLPEGTRLTYTGQAVSGAGAQAPPGGELVLDAQGSAEIALSHGQEIVIAGVPSTGWVRVAAQEIYDYAVSFTDSQDTEPTSGADTGLRQMAGEDRTFGFVNTRNEVVASGVLNGYSGMFVLFFAALAAMAAGLGVKAAWRRGKGAGRYGHTK